MTVGPRRGQLWSYTPALPGPGQSTLRVIVSADAVNANPDLPVVLGVHVTDSDPGGLLAVRVGHHGWARALTIEAVLRSRLAERIDTLDADTLDHLSAALRAAQDL